MAVVRITNISVLQEVAPLASPLAFEIEFQCISEIEEDLEWRITFVGSSKEEGLDQILDSILVGPIPVGMNKFVYQANGPDPTKLPTDELLGVTVILLSCAYKGREFVRVGYYVNIYYADSELAAAPPSTPVYEKLMRNILGATPRVTRFDIDWGYGVEAVPEQVEEEREDDLVLDEDDPDSMWDENLEMEANMEEEEAVEFEDLDDSSSVDSSSDLGGVLLKSPSPLSSDSPTEVLAK